MMVWLAMMTLPGGTTFKGGIAALKKFDDNKQNPTCEWRRVGGGHAGEVAKFCCACHKDCTRVVRVKKMVSTGLVIIQAEGDSEHTEVVATHDRKNAALSKAEKKEIKKAMRYGGTATDVVADMADDAVKAGSAKKKKVGGLEGALRA